MSRDDVIHDPERQQAEAVCPPLPSLADLNHLFYDDFQRNPGLVHSYIAT